MRDAGCSFPSLSRLLFLVPFLFSLAHCRAADIWGVETGEALQRLRAGDPGFLRLQEFSPDIQAQALRLGEGAPYYLAQWFRAIGMAERAQAMLWLEWERGTGLWKEEAALELLAEQASLRQWEQAEHLARRFLPSLRSPQARWRCERALVEALYWQRRDTETLDLLSALEGRRAALGFRDEELELFRAASSARLELQSWPELFRRLFLQRRASALHPRALSFLELNGRLERFSPAEAAYFAAKTALFEGRAEEALQLLENSLPQLAPRLDAGSPVLEETAAAAVAAGRPDRGLQLLLSLIEPASRPSSTPSVDPVSGPSFSSAVRPAALEQAGRLARRAGKPDAAEALLREAARDPLDPTRRDRASWQLLDSARQRSREAFLEEVGRQASSWADPSAFERLLDLEITDLVADRDWSGLARLRAALGASAPQGAGARLAFLAGRLASLQKAGGESDPAPSYRLALRLDPGGYYGWMARALLPPGEEPRAEPAPPADEPDPAEQNGNDVKNRPAPGAARSLDDFLLGFFRFGLYQTGYERVLAEIRFLSSDFLLRAARELNRREQFLLSLRLMNRALAAQSRSPRREELELFYPRAYRELVEERCAEEQLPPAVLYALVREESHFDPRIVSSSGAVGLTQLLPDTAREVADRMRLGEPDLNDPRQNLTLGARYLSRMLGLTGDLTRALMAYNAGLSRLRSWDRRFAGLPVDLLVESVPFLETRRYVRKILVSAVHYGALYAGLEPAEVVRLFYPHFRPLEEAR